MFLWEVQDIDIEYIRDSIDIKTKEQAAIDQHLQMLDTLSKSPTAPLRQQLSTVTISNQSLGPRVPVTGDPFTNASGGQGNLRFTQNTTPGGPLHYTRPNQTGSGTGPNPRPPSTAEQKAELRNLLNSLPHHPDTQAGRQAH